MPYVWGELKNGGIRICQECGDVTLENEMHWHKEIKLSNDDPIKKIEDEQGFKDMGKMGYLVFKGALEESDNWIEAYTITSAYFRGMFGGSTIQDDKDD